LRLIEEMSNMNKIYSSSLLIILSAALLFSCTKDISKIGVDVVGKNPLEVVYTDTITIETYSELIDSLRTDELSAHVLGAMVDPVFGTTNASVYSQFRIVDEYETTPFIGENPELDSIILYIKYAEEKIYGDTNYLQHFTVYELGEELIRDTAYYAFQNLRTKSDIIGEANFTPRFDSVTYITKPDDPFNTEPDTLSRIRPIRIPLSDDFGNRLLNLDLEKYQTQEAFLEEFKGLYITTLNQNIPSSGGSMVTANLNDPKTYIMLYYHNDTSSYMENGTEIFYNHEFKYKVDINTARFSNYNHYDYVNADADFRRQVIDGETELGVQKIYMQGLGGVRTTIKFVHGHKIPDYYNYAVNEAKLLLYNVDEESNLLPIDNLTLSRKFIEDGDTSNFLISDASGGERYFGGTYNSSDERYYFRITQYIQQLIEGDTDDNDLRIEIIGGAVHPNRLVAGGSMPTGLEEKRMVLQLIYTKIDNDE